MTTQAYQNGPSPTTMIDTQAQEVFQIDLGLTKLNVLRIGVGEPVLILPATISRLNDWRPLAEFVGQQFEAFFFELPGHGDSTPFAEPYRSDLTAEAIELLLDALSLEKVTILGFSFGGILTLKTLDRLGDRIKAVVLLAPCVGAESLRHSEPNRWLIRQFAQLLNRPRVQEKCLHLFRHEVTGRWLTNRVMQLGNLDGSPEGLYQKICQISQSTVDVLTRQLMEVTTLHFARPAQPLPQTCYFAMSVNDPLLDFDTVEAFLNDIFSAVHTIRLYHPYHQPPERLSLADFNREYGNLLADIATDYYRPDAAKQKWQPRSVPATTPLIDPAAETKRPSLTVAALG